MLIITGTYPPERCGVGDYCQQLLNTQAAKEWHLFYHKGWTMNHLRNKCHQLRQTQDKVINLQYPTMGYSTSLVPHILCLYAVICLHRQLIVTIHEYSQLGWKGKLATGILFRLARHVVFTTEFERQCAYRQHWGLKEKSSVIQINSNIPTSANSDKPIHERRFDVGYFGYIRPDKGLEAFLQAAQQIKAQLPDVKIYIMGQTQPEFQKFYVPFLAQVRDAGIEFIEDLQADAVAEQLANTKLMYLPYPDGLSERRGSYLAAIKNGALIITLLGKFTTTEQRSTFIFTSTAQAGEDILSTLRHSAQWNHMQNQLQVFCKQQIPQSWEEVAQKYNNIIKQL